MASAGLLINSRYQVKGKPIGEGGMGVVYKAYDVVTKRYVALKTMRGVVDPLALELFSKEWTVLARISHPNIVDILDSGELEDDGQRKPFFVMPYLKGATLDELIVKSSQRLTVERVIEIISQACKGLQAAHEQRLIHRDLKPSNIFVMEDDTAKIIDFGLVHLLGADSATGLKGTIQYMAPEQIEMKPVSPASDIFSLSVVCYQALTGRKPFARKTEAETAEAIRRHIPPPVSELNPLVTQMVSRVIHKGMAKVPWHRFSSAKEYAETLQKALNNQPIERFDQTKIQPRIDRAKKAQGEGDMQFASEILTELEAEGNIDPEMTVLRIQIDHAIRQKTIRQLIDTARTRLEEDEFPLALQKIQEVLDIDPENADGLSLKATIERQRSDRQIENWFRLVEQHIHNRAFAQARQALQEVLKINAAHPRASDLIVEVDRREQELSRLWAEKEQLYQSALSAYQHGEISSALTKLERVLDLNRQSPDSALPERDAQYQNLYNQIRTEREAARNSYAEGRRHMVDRNFGKALEICAQYLKRFPGDPMFQALELEIQEQQRQEHSSFIADVSRRAEAEPDLDRRLNILKEAAERYPNEQHFQQSLRLIRERRDLVNSIVGKARQYEERGQFSEALGQWDTLRNIYAQYPGIEFEVERLKRRREEQVREETRARWVEQIDRHIASGDHVRARDLARNALADFPEDRELAGLLRLEQQALERSTEAEGWLQRGQQLCFDRQFGDGLDALRKASLLDNRNPVIRAALLNALVEQARSVLGQDWRAAEPLIQQALSIDGGHPLAKSLQALVLDYKHQETVTECISRARDLQATGDLTGALETVDEALANHPNEIRLAQLRSTLRNLAGGSSTPTTPNALPSDSPAASQIRPANPASAPTRDSILTRAETVLLPTGLASPPVAEPGQPDLEQSIAEPAAPRQAVHSGKHAGGTFDRILVWLQEFGMPRRHSSPLQWLIFASVPVILLSAYLFTHLRNGDNNVVALSPKPYSVTVVSDVAGASFSVDGKPVTAFPLTLPAGEQHTAAAFLPGYKTASKVFSLEAGASNVQTVELHLEPEPVRVRLLSDLKAAQVSLDNQPPVDLLEGAFTSDSIAPGADHTLAVYVAGKETFSISFRGEPGGIVSLSSPIRKSDIEALVISNLAARARVYATNLGLQGEIKDRPARPIPPEGLDLTGLPLNPELVLDDGKSPRTVPFELANVPLLNIMLTSDSTLATLQVQSNVADADVIIGGGRKYTLRRGARRLQLPAGKYNIRVEHADYASEARSIELKKGEQLPLLIELKPIVRTASLVIADGTPGAEILMDGRRLASLDADGAYHKDDIPPGNHALAFRKQDHEDKEIPPRTFTAGQPVQISGAEAKLRPYGTLEFQVPDGVNVTWQRENDPDGHGERKGPGQVGVKAGRYRVTGTLGQDSQPKTIDVEPGKSGKFEWTPRPTEAKPTPTPPKPVPPKVMSTSARFTVPAAWIEKDGWWVHNVDGTSWLRENRGEYRIAMPRPNSKFGGLRKGRIEWLVDYKDEKNLIQYSLDSSGMFERKAIVNGNAQTKQIKLGSREAYTFVIDITSERILVTSGGNRDEYRRLNPAEDFGKFGFKGEASILIQTAPER